MDTTDTTSLFFASQKNPNKQTNKKNKYIIHHEKNDFTQPSFMLKVKIYQTIVGEIIKWFIAGSAFLTQSCNRHFYKSATGHCHNNTGVKHPDEA